jgi:branched-chain amino acid transport system permease protein
MRTGNYKESVGELIALSDSNAVWAWTVVLIAALVAAPFLVGAYALTLMVSALIAVIGAVGLNLLTGTTGLISLGQAGFLAVGAYTNAILLTDYHMPVWVGLPAAGIAGALVSIVVGIPSLRLKGLYLAITTLAFAFLINHIILMQKI